MNKLEQSARQALEALEELSGISEAVIALREALAEQSEQEPVAITVLANGLHYGVEFLDQVPLGAKLYAAPVRTKDLTDDEIAYIWRKYRDHITSTLGFARAVIAADREKNK